MNDGFQAKPYFEFFLKEILNPTLKEGGYTKKGKFTWNKVNGEAFLQIKLVKSRSNSAGGILFYFSIGLCPIELKDVKVEVHGDMLDWEWSKKTFVSRQNLFLSKERVLFKREAKLNTDEWYLIYRDDAFDKFINQEINVDFEEHILPTLEKIKTVKDVEMLIDYRKEKYGSIWHVNEVIG